MTCWLFSSDSFSEVLASASLFGADKEPPPDVGPGADMLFRFEAAGVVDLGVHPSDDSIVRADVDLFPIPLRSMLSREG